MDSSGKSSRAPRGHAGWHLAFAGVGLGLAAMFAWVLARDYAAHQLALQGLRRELALRERDLAQERQVLEEVSRDRGSRITQEDELDQVYERLARLSPSASNAPGRQQEERRLQKLIDCYPSVIKERVEKQRGIKKQCGCSPGDPLCACL